MNTFVSAIENQMTTTENGMVARQNSASACVDFFYKSGAMRGQDIIPTFVSAYVENNEIALRIAQWLRDVRGGAGERELFRNILQYLENTDSESCVKLLHKIPEIGRFDDLFAVQTKNMRKIAFEIYRKYLNDSNGLAFKYCPREKSSNRKDYVEFRNFLGLSAKDYRKFIVAGSNTTEQFMCAKKFEEINFSHVPSLCHARNKKAFLKNAPEQYKEYAKNLQNGTAKINADAVFPHDVLRGKIGFYGKLEWSETELTVIEQQWNALPNYVGEASVLPLVDVSGSMSCLVNGGKSSLCCLDIAVSLGLYVADKNTGPFKDVFLTFSRTPELVHLKGNINQKIDQMVSSHWAMNTDLEKALEKILNVAVTGKVSSEEMPKVLLVLSDMQFDEATDFNQTAMEMIRAKYAQSGYEVPVIVFWNLNAYSNCPSKFDESGVALISGFSPAILKSVLGNNLENISPENIMLETVMISRYEI